MVQGDPTEGALIVAARKAGLEAEALDARFDRVGEVPFSSERKLMSTIRTDAEQQERLLVFTKWWIKRFCSEITAATMKVKFYGTRGSIPVCHPEFQELKTKRGWGHSSYEQALQVAEMAGVKMLAITHHDPDHDDEFLRRRERECQQRFRACVLAREKMEIAL